MGLFRELWRLRLQRPQDDQIALRLADVCREEARLGHALCMDFDILDLRSGQPAGKLGVRIGESDSLFYLGHIGYHVDPAFRGHGYALRACKLCLPLFRRFHMNSLVITTDEDNLPSIRTCENLGCRLETVVDVPRWCQKEFKISQRKRRYILVLA